MAKSVAAGYDGDLDPTDVELLRRWRGGEISYDEMLARSVNPEALKRVAGEVAATSAGPFRGLVPPAEKVSPSSDVSRLLDAAIKYNASDLHLAPGRPPSVRIRGDLHNLGQTPLTPEDALQLMKGIASERHQEILEEEGDVRFSFSYANKARFRVCACKANGTITLTLRLLRYKLLDMETSGLPPVVKDLCMRPRGLVLVSGPNGAGKSTTLATLIDFINAERADHILTIEDPVEFIHPHKKCQVTHRELHGDVSSFAQGLQCASGLAADVILLGAMPDMETMEGALAAAESGALVLSSLNTTGAVATIDRFVASFPSERHDRTRQRLADALAAILSQTLIPTADGKGRVAAFELMFANPPIRELIRTGETEKIGGQIRKGAGEGMIPLDESLFKMWIAKRITYNDMMRNGLDTGKVEQWVRRYTEDMRGRGREGPPPDEDCRRWTEDHDVPPDEGV